MIDERLYVIAYDISDSRRRARVSDWLEDHLTRVQYSVFEGVLGVSQARAAISGVRRLLEPGDRLRVYELPLAAIDRIERFGGAPLPEPGPFWVL